MSDVEKNKPTLEEIQGQILDIITIGHDTLDDEHDELIKAIAELQTLMMEKPATYIYNPKNHKDFYKPIAVISSAISSVEFLVDEKKKEMSLLEKGGLPFDLSMSTPVQTNTEPKKEGFLSKLIKQGKPEIASNSPYQHMLPTVNQKQRKVVRIERFIEMYEQGIETAQVVNYNEEILTDLLIIHRSIFNSDMGFHLIMIHKQYIEMTKRNEKKSALSIGIATQRDMYRQEQARQFASGGQPPPT